MKQVDTREVQESSPNISEELSVIEQQIQHPKHKEIYEALQQNTTIHRMTATKTYTWNWSSEESTMSEAWFQLSSLPEGHYISVRKTATTINTYENWQIKKTPRQRYSVEYLDPINKKSLPLNDNQTLDELTRHAPDFIYDRTYTTELMWKTQERWHIHVLPQW